MTHTRDEILEELDVRLPQIRYALMFRDPDFGVKHLEHLETIISENRWKKPNE